MDSRAGSAVLAVYRRFQSQFRALLADRPKPRCNKALATIDLDLAF